MSRRVHLLFLGNYFWHFLLLENVLILLLSLSPSLSRKSREYEKLSSSFDYCLGNALSDGRRGALEVRFLIFCWSYFIFDDCSQTISFMLRLV